MAVPDFVLEQAEQEFRFIYGLIDAVHRGAGDQQELIAPRLQGLAGIEVGAGSTEQQNWRQSNCERRHQATPQAG
jgi:hypothetical protein